VFVEYFWEGDILRQFYGALFSPDGKRLATFGAGGAWMYTSPDGKLVSHLEGNNTRKAAFSPDGKWLVTSHFENFNSPMLIDFETAAKVFDLDVSTQNREGSRSVDYMQYAVSPNKRWIGMLRRGWNDPSRLGLVDTVTGLVSKTLDFEDAVPLSLAVNPTGTLIAVGRADGQICIVDFDKMTVIATLTGHRGPVNHLAFSPDGRFLVSGSSDGTISTWGVP
jgi:WD40 repeat protein